MKTILIMKNLNIPLQLISIFILIQLFTSCGLVKTNTVYVTKDSIVTKTETVYKDTLITIPGDTIRFQIPCDKDTVFINRSKSSSSLVQVKNGIVSVQNNCDEKDILITKLKETVDKLQVHRNDSIVVKTIKEKYIPKSYKIYKWGFWVALGVALVVSLITTNLWIAVLGAIVSIVKIISNKTKKKKKD